MKASVTTAICMSCSRTNRAHACGLSTELTLGKAFPSLDRTVITDRCLESEAKYSIMWSQREAMATMDIETRGYPHLKMRCLEHRFSKL